MKEKDWEKLNKQLLIFLEYNILPNMLAFSISNIYYSNLNNKENFYSIYNSIKSYINITYESKRLVINVMNNILKNHYNLEIVNYNPLIIKKIDF